MRVQRVMGNAALSLFMKGSRMRASLAGTDKVLGNDIILATSLIDRFKGLLGRKSLEPGQGMMLRPCKGIHTFFMKFPIDVVFLDKENQLIGLYKNLPPNRMTSIYSNAHAVLELPSGTLDEYTVIGSRIEFS